MPPRLISSIPKVEGGPRLRNNISNLAEWPVWKYISQSPAARVYKYLRAQTLKLKTVSLGPTLGGPSESEV